MEKSRIASIIIGGISVALVAFAVFLLIIKLLWAWTVVDLFPGAVEQGLVARDISWLSAVKIAIVLAVLASFMRREIKVTVKNRQEETDG
ncbi:MAG: hypothetical protein QF437_01015 [Planctomycetota bacterium]|jgi:hypothetical protein|nr:hypothetical protein [Planctomycetota bacterium]MDP7129039.1 hypothetical protein [Planctomycetota bacterium]MDP7250276.1 hypothetical protein [Planctomycetota bacterium]